MTNNFNRYVIEEIAEARFLGEQGLWLAVLISILHDIESPCRKSAYEQAREIILFREGCFDVMAENLRLEPGVFQKRILHALKRRGIDLVKEKTKE